MTSDLDSAQGELIYTAAVRIWQETQGVDDPSATPPVDWAGAVHSVIDQAIAHDTGLDIDVVRQWLHQFDGSRLVIGYYGDTVTVQAPLDPWVR